MGRGADALDELAEPDRAGRGRRPPTRARPNRPARPATTPWRPWPRSPPAWPTASSAPNNRRCAAPSARLVTGTHLVVQAGTGTGKSLAYLVPAVLSGKKVVVATATKALQDQLAEKDLPLVERGLGLHLLLRRAQGPEQLHLPPAGGRGGNGGIQPELGADAGAAGGRVGASPRPTTRTRSRGNGRGSGRPRRPGRRGAHPAGLGRRRPRPATGPT